jgi:hypothetical protein
MKRVLPEFLFLLNFFSTYKMQLDVTRPIIPGKMTTTFLMLRANKLECLARKNILTPLEFLLVDRELTLVDQRPKFIAL